MAKGSTARAGTGLAIVLVVIAAAAPSQVGQGTLFFLSELVLDVLVASATCFVVGIGGVAAFGNQVFFATSGYVVGYFALHRAQHEVLIALSLGLIAGTIAAIGGGLFLLRGTGLTFGLVTLALGAGAYAFVYQSQFAFGADGINGIPRGHLLGIGLESDRNMYWLILGVTVAGVAVIAFLRAAAFGRILAGTRDSRERSLALGVPVFRFQYAAFVIGGALVGLAGGLHALHAQTVQPYTFLWDQGAIPILAGLLGGIRTLSGPIIGTLLYQGITYEVGAITNAWLVILGSTFLTIFLLAPEGIVPVLSRRARHLSLRLRERKLGLVDDYDDGSGGQRTAHGGAVSGDAGGSQ